MTMNFMVTQEVSSKLYVSMLHYYRLPCRTFLTLSIFPQMIFNIHASFSSNFESLSCSFGAMPGWCSDCHVTRIWNFTIFQRTRTHSTRQESDFFRMLGGRAYARRVGMVQIARFITSPNWIPLTKCNTTKLLQFIDSRYFKIHLICK